MNPPKLLVARRTIFIAAALLPGMALADGYSSAVLSDAPLAYYPLGSATPPATAINSGSLGAALDGSHINVQHGAQGVLFNDSNPAVTYDGSGRTVIPYNAALNPPASESFTIEAWVRPAFDDVAPDGRAPLFNRHSSGPRQGWVIFQRDSTTAGWNFRMYNGGNDPSISITAGDRFPGAWTHLAVVWDGSTSTATMYVDGLPVPGGSQTLVGGYVPNADIPFSVGAYSADSPGDNAFLGDVDEVAFYPQALTATQIGDHFNNAYDPVRTESYASVVAGDGATLHLRMDEPESWRVVARNAGSLGSDGNGLHFPGAAHQVPGALATGGDTAVGYDRIDKESTDGGYPTVLPNTPALNTESFSWEAWVRPTAEGTGNAQCLVMNHDAPNETTRTGWVIWQRASGSVGWNLRLYNGIGNTRTIDINTGNGYTIGQWQHLAVTYDQPSQTAVFYVNSTAVVTQNTAQGPYVPNPGTVVPAIGGFANGTENPFQGDLDEVAFYDEALTSTQVAAHYANGTSASPAIPYDELIESHEPVVYYRMNDAAKTMVVNAGTLAAAADAVMANAPEVIAGPQPPAYGGFDPGTAASLFDGDNTYLELRNPAGLNFTGPVTFEAWVQPGASQPNFDANIISHGGNHDFSGEVFLRIENGNYEVGANGGKASFAIPAADLGTGTWVHLAGTWSAGQWTLYRNGSQVATGSDPNGPLLVNNANWAVGARGRWKYGAGFPSNQDAGEARVFNGGITDAAIYSTALSAAKIKAHFFAGIGNMPLLITNPSGTITLDWAGGILQESDDLIEWNDVPAATAPYMPADGPRHFYRLRY